MKTRRTVGSPGAASPSFAIWGSFRPPAPRGTSSPPPRAPTPPSRPPPPPPRSPPGPSSAADAPRSASATALSRSGSFRLAAATARSARGPAVRRAPRRPRRTRSARRTPGPGHWRRRELAPRRNRSAVAAPRTGPRAGRPRADRGVFGLPELQRGGSGSATTRSRLDQMLAPSGAGRTTSRGRRSSDGIDRPARDGPRGRASVARASSRSWATQPVLAMMLWNLGGRPVGRAARASPADPVRTYRTIPGAADDCPMSATAGRACARTA